MRIVTMSAAVVLLSGLGAATGSAVVPTACDLDNDSYVSTTEAKSCTEQRFEELRAGQEGLGPEQFARAFPDAQKPDELFKRVDRDGDGQISHEEWTRWQAQGFAAATESNDSRMPAADYQSMKWVEGAYARPTAGQNNQ